MSNCCHIVQPRGIEWGCSQLHFIPAVCGMIDCSKVVLLSFIMPHLILTLTSYFFFDAGNFFSRYWIQSLLSQKFQGSTLGKIIMVQISRTHISWSNSFHKWNFGRKHIVYGEVPHIIWVIWIIVVLWRPGVKNGRDPFGYVTCTWPLSSQTWSWRNTVKHISH